MKNITFLVQTVVVFTLFACSQSSNEERRSKAGGDNVSLIHAVRAGDYPTTKRLIEDGANVNLNIGTPDSQITPLMIAVLYRHPTLVGLLLQKGAHPSSSFENYNSEDFARHLYGERGDITRIFLMKNK